MSEANRRGLIIFGIIVAAMVACAVITFGILPSNNVSVALPVITVPGEALNGALPSQDFNFTNTLFSTLLADAFVLIVIVLAWRSSKGWTREVPGRFQTVIELLGNFIYGQTKSFAGERPLAKRWLFPLAASIFLFLLCVNWQGFIPGVESVGVMHCAHAGVTGYPAQQVGSGAFQLYVDRPLNSGYSTDEAGEHACEEFFHHGDVHGPSASDINVAATALTAAEAALRADLTTQGAAAEDIEQQVEALRLEHVGEVYHDAVIPLTGDQLSRGALPYVFAVTPFFRVAATDLNLAIGLALIAIVAVQIFGVAAQGPGYFQKFINIHALGTIQQKPLGAIDFIVGIVEIISELGKIISLAFRLFGNIFAGAIVIAVMSFMVAVLLPVVFYGLELIITSIQAYVFAILTIVFAAQAMEGHGSHEEHEEAHHHEDGDTVAEPDPSLPVNRTAI